MKINKTLVIAALSALSVGGASASIGDTNFITGSTAFRKAANSQIAAWVESQGSTVQGNGLVWSDTAGASPVGATDIAWQWVSGTTTNYIVAHWSGSEGGIQNTAAPQGTKQYLYLNPSTASLAATPVTFVTGLTAGSTNAGNTILENGNITFADTTQASSLFKNTYAGTTYTALANGGASSNAPQVGVVTFAWVTSNSNAVNANITNVTDYNARNILNLGRLPVALLTGNTADTSSYVWLVGRDIDSGTRSTTLGVTGYGTTKAVKQYFVGTYNGGTTNAVYLTPATSVDGVTEVQGNAGYTSGSGSSATGLIYNIKTYGVLATGTALTYDTNSTPWTASGPNYLIGYAGTGDAGKSSSTGAVSVRLLAFNGTTYSDQAVQQGQYGFWGYENLYYNSSTATANTVTIANGVAADVLAQPAGDANSGLFNAGVPLSSMNCSRGSDFAVIVQGY